MVERVKLCVKLAIQIIHNSIHLSIIFNSLSHTIYKKRSFVDDDDQISLYMKNNNNNNTSQNSKVHVSVILHSALAKI